MKKKPVVWLARDPKNAVFDGCYSVGLGKKPAHSNAGDFWGTFLLTSEKFESIAPKSCHLKPGEGPIKISVKIERVK